MEVQRLDGGLWRWTGLHPDWHPPPGSLLPREVSSLYYEAPDAVVLVDPIAPPEDRERFLAALDRDVGRLALPLAIVLTSPWHARSAEELADRYGGEIWTPGQDPRSPAERASRYAPGDALPGGMESFDAHFHGEALLWVPARRTLVAGDVLHVSAGELRLPPEDWLPEEERAGAIRRSLAFLAELQVERVLVGHGAPVVADARGALRRLLG